MIPYIMIKQQGIKMPYPLFSRDWCITKKCARFFFKLNGRNGKFLLYLRDKDLIEWVAVFWQGVVDDEYSFVRFENLDRFSGSDVPLVCLHFVRKLWLNHPQMD